jgi:hypothetical protein
MMITALDIAGSSSSSLIQNAVAVLKVVRHLFPSWMRKKDARNDERKNRLINMKRRPL